MSYLEFIKENVTINVFISVIVYTLFSTIHEKILIPILDIILDILLDKFKIKDRDFDIGPKKIKYGVIIKEILSTIILLSLIYIFRKF
jgi:large-conductance mechanosensitive channel